MLWTARQEDDDPVVFAAKLQRFCRSMNEVDERLVGLKRGRSKMFFADLPEDKAAAFVRKDAYVTGLIGVSSARRFIGLSASSGRSHTSPGKVRAIADNAFWQDEALIRRVAAAMIDFWQADQACVYTLRLPDTDWRPDQPWHFWLDWRRTADAPTLMPDVRASGEPAIERAWHGGVERVWPEYAPWDHVTPRGTAPE